MAQRVQESIEVQAPLQDVFTYWSNLEHFPQIMSNIEEVRVAGDTSHWRVKGPLGKTVEFDARTSEMNPEREMREDLENFARQVERGELDLGGPGAQAR